MKILVPCPHPACDFLNKQPTTPQYAVSISDDLICRFTCDNGHEVMVPLQDVRFEVLAQTGANAIVDGYYREAVASFTASLERFFEFYLSVVANERDVAKDRWTNAWKLVSNQSERQLGAVIFV